MSNNHLLNLSISNQYKPLTAGISVEALGAKADVGTAAVLTGHMPHEAKPLRMLASVYEHCQAFISSEGKVHLFTTCRGCSDMKSEQCSLYDFLNGPKTDLSNGCK